MTAPRETPQHEPGWTRPHSEMLKLAAAHHAERRGETVSHGDCASCQMASDVIALVAEIERGAGDRLPAPSAHTVIDFALDEIIRLGQAARPFVDEVAIAKHRGAIHDAVRAVRPTPRAAPSDAAIAAARAVAKDAEWERWDPSYKVRQMLRAAYAVDFGASPAAAPPQETGR